MSRRSGRASRRSSPSSLPAQPGPARPSRRAPTAARRVAHRAIPGPVRDQPAYVQMLRDIGYLVAEPEPFRIETRDVDDEVAVQAGPQLVVPVLNARFAANAANARWGSLYDALYGTDVLSEDDGCERGTSYNPRRGAQVISRARAFLDEHFPLARAATPTPAATQSTTVRSRSHSPTEPTGLADPSQYVGHRGGPAEPEGVLLSHHGLHVEIQVDRDHPIGRDDAAGVKDLLLEAAVSTIMDLEDSDRRGRHRRQGGRLPQLALAEPGHAERPGRQGRGLLRPDPRPGQGVRRTRRAGGPPRTLAALRPAGRAPDDDRRRPGQRGGGGPRRDPRRRRDRTVQPGRPAGPKRAPQLADRLDVCGEAEDARTRRGRLHRRPVRAGGRPARARPRRDQARHHGRGASYLGQPRRLHPCRPRPRRLHQHRLPRPDRRRAPHLDARRTDGAQGRHEVPAVDPGLRGPNVDIGLACGLQGRAQIGKGMWAMPDEMAAMLDQKIGHPKAGASCAWVPSPTAATLHALHYHQVDVSARQRELTGGRRRRSSSC